jgi:hypothetical protein
VIFSNPDNAAAQARLADALRSGTLLAFVGAGVTKPLGYPSWPELVRRLASEVRRIRGEDVQSNGLVIRVRDVLENFNDPLVQAQILKENLGTRYFQIMREVFGPRDAQARSVADLVSLPFKHLLTSNYDTGLEQHHLVGAIPGSICLYHDATAEFIAHFLDSRFARRIVHVHGRYDEPERLILTQQDYDAYNTVPIFERFWNVMTSAATLAFFGFSFADLELLYGFTAATRVLRPSGGNQEVRHFAVLGLADESLEAAKRITFRMKYGIEPVCFLQQGNDFSGYDEILASLRTEGAALPPTAGEEATPGVVIARSDELFAPETAADATDPRIRASVEQLRRLTRENITRRETGDLE